MKKFLIFMFFISFSVLDTKCVFSEELNEQDAIKNLSTTLIHDILKQYNESLRSQITQKEEEIEQKEQELAEKQSELDEKQSELDEKQSELEAAQLEAEKKGSELEDTKSKLQKLQRKTKIYSNTDDWPNPKGHDTSVTPTSLGVSTKNSNKNNKEISNKKIEELSNKIKSGLKVSVWKDKDGKFNKHRLLSDSIAGVVLGTAGGLITSTVMKKVQVKNGYEDIQCTINGQSVASYGDEFSVGIK